jgi:hypothetical protein
MYTPVWTHKISFEKSTIVSQEYFAGVSDDNLQKMIGHTYLNNIIEIRQTVEKYVGTPINFKTHDSKVVQAYLRIKQPKFVTIKEILKILK